MKNLTGVVVALEQAVAGLVPHEAELGIGRLLRDLRFELLAHTVRAKNANNKPKADVKFIQVGGGSHRIVGFTNVDIAEPCDVEWDVRMGLPFSFETAVEIFTEHMLEHIDFPVGAEVFVKSCFNVLKVGGTLIAGVPDAGRVLIDYQKNPEGIQLIYKSCFGHRPTPPKCLSDIDVVNLVFRDEYYRPGYSPHLWAYDEKSLGELLRQCGFGTVERIEPPIYANPRRRDSTLYLQARK